MTGCRRKGCLAGVEPFTDPWTKAVVALFEVAAETTKREGRSYGEWLRTVTAKATAMCEAASRA